VFYFTVAMSVFFSILIAGLIGFFMIRYRRRNEATIGEKTKSNDMLELAWTIIPLILLLFLFGWGAKVFFTISRPPADAVEYFGTGKRWMWKFQHPEGNREINMLHVPVNTPIKVTLTSEDVIHSFFVPAFRVKMDAVPGRYTTAWFEATKTGRFRLFCAEYCGAEHSLMGGWVVVMEPHDYEAWLSGERPGKSVAASGRELFETKACITCHRSDTAARAPILDGIYGHEQKLVGGKIAMVDDGYIRESIMDPQEKIVEGYQPIMPTYKGQLSEDELRELIMYIKSLSDESSSASAVEDAASGEGE
jgi:cytochrome c oxidase subunit 2